MKKKTYNGIVALGLVATLICCGAMIACSKKATTKPDVKEEPVAGVTFEASTAIFANPERGFTKTFTVRTALNPVALKTYRANQNTTLLVRVFYLENYKNKALDQTALTFIQTDLNSMRDAGLKGIVRFAYTEDMAGTDAPLAIVKQQIDQLKPVFEANKDVIAFVQAGFIGAYGEWHSSSNGLATSENEREVLTKLLSVVPADIMVQVRTPGQKQQTLNTTAAVTEAQGYSGQNIARVGHHNDCFLSSTDDYGTYGSDVAAEKLYISNDALYVPVGGETCPPIGGYSSDCAQGRLQMKLLKWTYLNMDYYQPTLSAWRTSGCFEEFERNLGYRLAFVSANLPATATVNGSLKLAVNITNVGYAPLYNKKTTSLILKNKTTGAYYDVPLTYDLRKVKPAATITLDETLNLASVPAGDYALYLRVADQAPTLKSRVEYAIRFANANVWVEENGGMNDLKSSLKIN